MRSLACDRSFVRSLLRLHDRLEVHKTIIIIYSLRIMWIECHSCTQPLPCGIVDGCARTHSMLAHNSHVSMCVCVSRLRLRLSAEHNHFIVIASDVFCLSTQHSMCHVSRLHYVLCIWKACWGLHEQQIAV